MERLRHFYLAAAASLSKQPHWWLALLVAVTAAARLLAIAALNAPLESDFLAYFDMAKSLAESGDMRDSAGLQAFYSAGYPLFLTPLFAIFGAGPLVGQLANVALGAASTTLVYLCARELSRNSVVALIAVAIFACYPATYMYSAYLAKENLSTPVLLAQVLFLSKLLRNDDGRWDAAAFGILSAVQMLTGPSAILVSMLGVPIIVLIWRKRPQSAVYVFASMLVAFTATLGPWLYYTNSILGKPLLNTNAGFNLYIGNNPSATGMFVSISETPVGPTWHRDLRSKGEVQQMLELRDKAVEYMLAHPGRTAALTLKKLALFWTPPFHEGRDGNQSHAETIARTTWGLHYLVVLALFAVHVSRFAQWSPGELILFASIALFWLAHGPFYIIFRYREPAMPLIMIAASCGLWFAIETWLRPIWRRLAEQTTIR